MMMMIKQAYKGHITNVYCYDHTTYGVIVMCIYNYYSHYTDGVEGQVFIMIVFSGSRQ